MYGSSFQSKLLRFGYQFLGPFLVDWYNRLYDASANCDGDTIYLLGREGWSVVPLFNNFNAMRGTTDKRFVYLQTSRALLTHMTLAQPELETFAFDVAFEGTIQQFFENRLCLHYSMLRMPAVADQFIRLPRDRTYVIDLYRPNSGRAVSMAATSRDAYRGYLDKIGFGTDQPQMLSDLGFRGTSQALLTSIYGHSIDGFYVMLDPSGPPRPLDFGAGSARGLFVDDRKFGEDYAPLEKSLLFEAFLTAPFGQVSGIRNVGQGDPFLYRDGTAAQRNYALIAECFQGAQKFALDHSDLLGSKLPLIENFAIFFESFKDTLILSLDQFADILELDDSFYGNELLSAEIKL